MGIIKDVKDGNRYYLQEETYYDATQRGVAQSDSDRVEDILRLQNKYGLNRRSTIYLPHDAASLKAQCKQDPRIQMKVRTYAPDTFKDIARTQDLFNNQRFFIHESCKNSIAQVQTYCWDTKAQQRGEDKPLKVDDHCPDMWRGGLYGSRLSRQRQRINA